MPCHTHMHMLSRSHTYTYTAREKQRVQSHRNPCATRWEAMNNDDRIEGHYCQTVSRGKAIAPTACLCLRMCVCVCHGIFLAKLPATESWRHMKGPEESCPGAKELSGGCQVNTQTQNTLPLSAGRSFWHEWFDQSKCATKRSPFHPFLRCCKTSFPYPLNM